MIYVQLAIAPVIVILTYIYYRDKYNKEPFWLLFFLFVAGMFSVLPVLGVGYLSDYFIRYFRGLYRVAYTAFVQAAFIEEFWKLFFTFVIAWWAKAFDERFDGIVYAVTVSMGFAVVENIMYVTGYGFTTGLLRMITAVPAHAIFGISMGYYLGKAKFDKPKAIYLILAFIVPWLMHGIYDFLIMAGVPWMVIAFIAFLIIMYIYGFLRLKNLSKYKVKPAPPVNDAVINDTYYNASANTPERGFETNADQTENDDTFADTEHSSLTENQAVQTGGGVQQNTFTQPPPTNSFTQNQTPNYQQNNDGRGFSQTPPIQSKNNLDTLSILFYVWGGLKIFAALFVLIYVFMGAGLIAGGVYDGDTEMQFAGGFFLIFGLVGFLMIVAMGILNIMAGKYLTSKKNRMFCLIIAGLACLNAPLGTILGIFTIIEIEKPEIKRLFENNV